MRLDLCGNDSVGTDNEVIMLEEKTAIINVVSLAGTILETALEQIKDDGYAQALVMAAFLETIKAMNVLNPSVDMAVSFNGIVIRNEEAADYSQ